MRIPSASPSPSLISASALPTPESQELPCRVSPAAPIQACPSFGALPLPGQTPEPMSVQITAARRERLERNLRDPDFVLERVHHSHSVLAGPPMSFTRAGELHSCSVQGLRRWPRLDSLDEQWTPLPPGVEPMLGYVESEERCTCVVASLDEPVLSILEEGGQQRGRLRVAPDKMSSMGFAADGKRSASVSQDGTVEIYDLEGASALLRHRFQVPEGTRMLGFSPQGWLWLQDAAGAHLYEGSQRIHALDAQPAATPFWSRDGQQVVWIEMPGLPNKAPVGAQVMVWQAGSAPTQALSVSAPCPPMIFETHAGLRLLQTENEGLGVKVVDPFHPQNETCWESDVDVVGAAMSPDGKVVALADSATVSLWTLEADGRVTRRQTLALPSSAHFSGDRLLAFSPDGTRLLINTNIRRSFMSWRCDVLDLAAPGGHAPDLARATRQPLYQKMHAWMMRKHANGESRPVMVADHVSHLIRRQGQAKALMSSILKHTPAGSDTADEAAVLADMQAWMAPHEMAWSEEMKRERELDSEHPEYPTEDEEG